MRSSGNSGPKGFAITFDFANKTLIPSCSTAVQDDHQRRKNIHRLAARREPDNLERLAFACFLVPRASCLMPAIDRQECPLDLLFQSVSKHALDCLAGWELS